MKENNTVSFIAYEATGARYERIIKRLVVACIINTLTTLFCIILSHKKEK